MKLKTLTALALTFFLGAGSSYAGMGGGPMGGAGSWIESWMGGMGGGPMGPGGMGGSMGGGMGGPGMGGQGMGGQGMGGPGMGNPGMGGYGYGTGGPMGGYGYGPGAPGMGGPGTGNYGYGLGGPGMRGPGPGGAPGMGYGAGTAGPNRGGRTATPEYARGMAQQLDAEIRAARGRGESVTEAERLRDLANSAFGKGQYGVAVRRYQAARGTLKAGVR